MKNKYRIVTDEYAGNEAQVRYWWFPFRYFQIGINTFTSVEKAQEFIASLSNKKDKIKKVLWNSDPVSEVKRIINL